MATDYKFAGWMAEDPASIEGKMVWKEYQPKEWEETDIDIKITHSGMCASDLHTISNGWVRATTNNLPQKSAPALHHIGPFGLFLCSFADISQQGGTNYPCVVGHEIVGVAVRVGSKAEGNIKVGDMVGVGAQSDSCQSRFGACGACESHLEQYCDRITTTFNSKHFNGDTSYGGYALYNRCPSHFVIKLPPGLKPEYAAPMLCGGVTVYSPLKAFGCGPGKKIGVAGVGGLGHFAVLFAKVMGADEVVGISRKADKRKDALELGCDDYIATDDDEGWAQKNAGRFDLIISTVSSAKV